MTDLAPTPEGHGPNTALIGTPGSRGRLATPCLVLDLPRLKANIATAASHAKAHGVALRPASPSGLGFVEGVPVLLAPGNPVSCLCAYDLLGSRIVRRLGGRSGGGPYPRIDAPLAEIA